MGKLRQTILIGILVFVTSLTQGQNQLKTDVVLSFFEAVYAYDFQLAKTRLEQVKKKHSGEAQALLCESNYYWWLMMTGHEDDHTVQQFEKVNQKIINTFSTKEPDALSREGIFSIIHGYAYQTRYALHHKKHIEGISNLSKIMPYLRIVLDHPYENTNFKFAAGLYHYLAAVTIEEHPIFRPFFKLAPKSDKELGYNLLIESAESSDPLIQTEASYFLMKINLEIASNYTEAVKWSKFLVREYPNNILYHFYLLNSYVEQGYKFSAKQAYKSIQNLSGSLPNLTTGQRMHFQELGQERIDQLK